MLRSIAVLAAVLIPSLAWAKPPKSAEPEPREVVFDQDLIEGGLDAPMGEVVEVPRSQEHGSVIQVRESFEREVVDSVSELGVMR